MGNTIGRVAGESDITAGIQTKGLRKINGSHNANAPKTESITKAKLVLLLTQDIQLEQQSAVAAATSSARLVVARTVGVALEILHQRGRELDLIIIDFDNDGGMALARTLTTSCAELPMVALTSTDSDRSIVRAWADPNACCLTKPINAVELEMLIRGLGPSRLQADRAPSKQRIKPRVSNLSHTSRTRGTIVRRLKEQKSS